MKLIYLAHPVAGDVPGNLKKARAWMKLIQNHTGHAVMADWITECEIYDDANPEERAAGFQRNFKRLEICDEIYIAGESEALKKSRGMKAEFVHASGLKLPALRVECNASPFGDDFGGIITAPFCPAPDWWEV